MPCARLLPTTLAAVLCAFLAAAGVASAAPSPAETGLLHAVNTARSARGLQPLSLDPNLTLAAHRHSAAMIRSGDFTHGDFAGRMLALHVHGSSKGEDLAWGTGSYASAGAVIALWLNSPEHRAILLSRAFTRVGLGAARGTFLGSRDATVVTADFAAG